MSLPHGCGSVRIALNVTTISNARIVSVISQFESLWWCDLVSDVDVKTYNEVREGYLAIKPWPYSYTMTYYNEFLEH